MCHSLRRQWDTRKLKLTFSLDYVIITLNVTFLCWIAQQSNYRQGRLSSMQVSLYGAKHSSRSVSVTFISTQHVYSTANCMKSHDSISQGRQVALLLNRSHIIHQWADHLKTIILWQRLVERSSHIERGQRDLALTPATALHLDHESSSGENVCDDCDAEKHVFELPFAPKCMLKTRRGLPKKTCTWGVVGTQIDSLWFGVCFSRASVFLLQLKKTSRRKRSAPLQGLECGEEIIRTLRETRLLFAGVCDSTHQHGIN